MYNICIPKLALVNLVAIKQSVLWPVRTVLFLFQKQMYPFSNCFSTSDSMVFAICSQFFFCFHIKPDTISYFFWLICFWPTCWTNFPHLPNLCHAFIILLSRKNVNTFFAKLQKEQDKANHPALFFFSVIYFTYRRLASLTNIFS